LWKRGERTDSKIKGERDTKMEGEREQRTIAGMK